MFELSTFTKSPINTTVNFPQWRLKNNKKIYIDVFLQNKIFYWPFSFYLPFEQAKHCTSVGLPPPLPIKIPNTLSETIPGQVHNISPRFLPNQINKLGTQKGQTEFEEVVEEMLKESYTLHTDKFILNILKTRMFKDTNYEKTRQQPLKSQMS